jgi:transposase
MLGLTPTTRVFLKTGATDGRLGADALKGLVTQIVREDPHGRQHLFCFCNRAKNRLKLLWHDGTGFWVAGKHLPCSTYNFPQDAAAVSHMSMEQLEVLVRGVRFTSATSGYRR